MTSPGSSRTAVRPIAGLRATHRARLRAWWRAPALRRMTRRQANLALVLVGVLSLALAGGAPGGMMIDSAWGAVAPGPVVVTVFTAVAGSHGGLDSAAATIPRDEDVTWSGRAAHAIGVEVSDGDLVILSVSAPVAAFDSGTLQESFRTARVRAVHRAPGSVPHPS